MVSMSGGEEESSRCEVFGVLTLIPWHARYHVRDPTVPGHPAAPFACVRRGPRRSLPWAFCDATDLQRQRLEDVACGADRQ